MKYKAEFKTDKQIFIKPIVYLGVGYDINNNSNNINVTVADRKYTIFSERLSRLGVNGGFELSVSRDILDFVLGYDLNLYNKYEAHTGQIRFQYNF